MQARENIRSVSYLKSHAAQISDDVAANGAPFIITQNGEAAMVIEGVQQYQDKEDLIALLKLLALGEKDRQAGLGLSVQESRAQLTRVDAGLITGPGVSLLGNVGITDYRTVLTSHHRVLTGS